MSKIQCFMVEAPGDGRFVHDGKRLSLEELPDGAMYYADWYARRGSDGHYLIVKTPGGLWHIDGRANNCSKPQDKIHRCWIRHGVAPNITVDKDGDTCSCGHSIGFGKNYELYHGFLRDGYLVPA